MLQNFISNSFSGNNIESRLKVNKYILTYPIAEQQEYDFSSEKISGKTSIQKSLKNQILRKKKLLAQKYNSHETRI